jgi:LPS sulfotransferase NodH
MSVRVAAFHNFARSQALRRIRLPLRPVRVIRARPQPIPAVVPAITYVICTSPRSGSWLLSDGLFSTGVAGNPREWFNALEEQHQRAVWRMWHATDLSLPGYLRFVRSKSTTNNSVFGTKIHFYQFADLPQKLNTPELTASQLMSHLFPAAKYIWLTRRDKARQAISLAIACQTNKWWNVSQQETCADSNLRFDAEVVSRMEHVLVQSDLNWQNFFHENEITPLAIYYEDLASDYSGTIATILKWLGVPDADAVGIPPPRFRRQSNRTNEEWLAQYREFKASLDAPAEVFYGRDALSGGWVPQAFQAIPNIWKQWIGLSKVRRTTDDDIIGVLVKNGYSHSLALAAVKEADSDPYLIGAARARTTPVSQSR